MVWAKDLREGDSMQIPKGLGYSSVLRITNGYISGWLHVTLAVMPKGMGEFYPITPTSPVMVMRVGQCGAPCCDACSREVSDGHHYCLAHWDAWERVGERGEVEQTQQLE